MSNIEYEIIIALLAGLLSGLLSEVGSTGSFISLPMMISLGLPPLVANGTSRVGSIAIYGSAFFAYKSHKEIDLRSSLIVAIPVVIGTLIGALVAVHIHETVMQWMIVGLTILMALFTVFDIDMVNRTDATKNPVQRLNFISILILFVAGLYCGLILQAMAYLIFFILVRIMGVDMEIARGMKFFIVMIITPFSLLIFILFGHINWLVALFLFIGASFGGFFGERLLRGMPEKHTKELIFWSLILSSLYLSLFILKHFSNGITII